MESMKKLSSGYQPAETPLGILEDPQIAYPRRQTIGRYADILYDQWFKKILGAEGNEEIILDILRELIPERDIATTTISIPIRPCTSSVS